MAFLAMGAGKCQSLCDTSSDAGVIDPDCSSFNRANTQSGGTLDTSEALLDNLNQLEEPHNRPPA
jgi:hypothetical protein